MLYLNEIFCMLYNICTYLLLSFLLLLSSTSLPEHACYDAVYGAYHIEQ